jgi:hypothetical protein
MARADPNPAGRSAPSFQADVEPRRIMTARRDEAWRREWLPPDTIGVGTAGCFGTE